MNTRLKVFTVFVLAAAGCSAYTAPTNPAATSDRGAFTLTVSGALNGSTHLEAPPLLDSLGTHGNFVGMASPAEAGLFVVRVQKTISDISTTGGGDAGVIAINPTVTGTGVFHNGSCQDAEGQPAACIGVTYSVGGGLPGTSGASLSVLTTLEDNRDTVTVNELTTNRVRISVAGPFAWSHQATSTSAVRVDTVFVRASFDAFFAHA
ncbi:MAG TPA: hypothetical protein VGM82_00425 [Gemmatimonadaceae bacterium]|jgi:hypothetical protein